MTTDQTLSETTTTGTPKQDILDEEEGGPPIHAHEEEEATPEEKASIEQEAKEEEMRIHRELGYSFLELNGFITFLDREIKLVVQRTTELLNDATAREKITAEEALEVLSRVRSFINITKPVIIKSHVKCVVQHLTADELRPITEFLASPLGKKFQMGLVQVKEHTMEPVEAWIQDIWNKSADVRKRDPKSGVPGLISELLSAVLGAGKVEVVTDEDLEKLRKDLGRPQKSETKKE